MNNMYTIVMLLVVHSNMVEDFYVHNLYIRAFTIPIVKDIFNGSTTKYLEFFVQYFKSNSLYTVGIENF